MVNRLQNKRVEIRRSQDDTIRVFYGNKELKYVCAEYVTEHKTLDNKEKLTWKPKNTYHPPLTHPFKRYGYGQDELKKWRKVV